MLQNMSTTDKDEVSVCANCGKEGSSDNMNTCNKCKQVKYCNAVCKKKHRHKHKKECEEHIRRVAELHDEKLFKQPPPPFGDCPICFLRIPSLTKGWGYQTCCGTIICCGCSNAPVYDDQGNIVDNDKQNECPFCRVVAPYTMGEAIEREKKRMELDDPIAIYNQGNCYRDGKYGCRQDYTKALELWHQAAELGFAKKSYNNIGNAYNNGIGVEVDKKKAMHYFELAAMGGDEVARHNLGNNEALSGNKSRALKHYMIAVRGGHSKSLGVIKQMYTKGDATKDDYTKALQSFQAYLGEIKSPQRDKAAAADDQFRYY